MCACNIDSHLMINFQKATLTNNENVVLVVVVLQHLNCIEQRFSNVKFQNENVCFSAMFLILCKVIPIHFHYPKPFSKLELINGSQTFHKKHITI